MAAVRCSVVLCAVVTALCTVCHVVAMETYTPDEVFIENGTQVKLPCSFVSTETPNNLTAVTWKFLSESTKKDNPIRLFYYTNWTPYPQKDGHFKERVMWAGDLRKNDASIKINNAQFNDNGTYICEVISPPDVEDSVKSNNHIKLRVLERENLPASNAPFWVGIICGVIGGLLLIAIIVFALVLYKKRKQRKSYTGCSPTESLTPVKQPPRKSPSDTEALVDKIPSGPIQGPVIYAQLDHSGKSGNQINKSESVVYAHLRKNC
ncbi:myelin protein zero-like protein 1 isoform X2 [Bombina bombina]|uniref:myelin protein zero-like protein 1 isoform X2 n=1 Tax=Bombina bombina TaxID=8345 RepID=UPI00235B1308|nr:myelin protein zero-like protein 1 isoform X2 [Bombina bombina]